MVRKIISLFLLLLLLCPVEATGEAIPQPVEDARESVVHLYGIGTDEETGQRIRWTGTGFAVGIAGEDSDIFLTNWHVATGSGRCGAEPVRLWLLLDGARLDENQIPMDGCAIECRVLATTAGYPDIAVIQTVEPVEGYPALPLLSSRRVTDGTAVYAIGFPGLKDSNYGEYSGPEDATVTAGVITDHLTMTSAGNTRTIIHTASTRHGNSGGPLLNKDGAVVAQTAYGFEDDVSTDLFCSVYIDYAAQMLTELGIPYTESGGASVLTVWVADLLHWPDIPNWIAWTLTALAGMGIIWFIFTFVKTAREAAEEIRKLLQKRMNKEEKKGKSEEIIS